ncbi:MAG: GNAT family N-acetyltransferase [Lewinellaceae bacterium]|nr:GNAT family N-acetyltransferase [Lewinellaceae bacterium]
MPYHFKEITSTPERFFSILPADWRGAIAPYWPEYSGTARIFTLESGDEVVGGGILFSTPAPDILAYGEEARYWFENGFLYIGFLWIAEVHRGKQLGSLWLQQLQDRLPGQSFWLSIDDYSLKGFYERNGYRLVKEVSLETGTEWVMTKG